MGGELRFDQEDAEIGESPRETNECNNWQKRGQGAISLGSDTSQEERIWLAQLKNQCVVLLEAIGWNLVRDEFKCPYSDDCDINSVSRRFCQKCRLRKCFTVGMKKEWILNEEQLRRRKNSRLNHMQSQNAANNNSPIAKAPVAINVTTSNHLGSSAPTTPSGMGAAHLLSRRSTEQPMVSPPSVNSMLSPSRSTVSPSVLSSSSPDSPPTRGAILGLPHIDNNTDAYESNMMRLQRQQAAAANAAYANMRRNSCGPGLSPGAAATAVSPLTRPSDQFMIKGSLHHFITCRRTSVIPS
ncbi:unnamed protein product [Toxocara canis]|uniref:Nuclear receptor domain-containing protein n=1 Tax=Toxocara canis TaxID=6265 RepID=A0A183VEM9_TOXCA|nr:unnamed protein product [Toxocara canis]